jgi:chromosome segregation ATPase
MITWLDEQHRQDRRELEELREQVKKQNEQFIDLNKRLEESEGRFTHMQTQLQLLSRLEEAVEQVKGDVVMRLRAREEEWKKQIDAEAKSRRADEERVNRSLGEITTEVRSLWKADLSTQNSELNRLTEAVLRQKSQVEDADGKVRKMVDRVQLVEGEVGKLRDATSGDRFGEILKRIDQQAAKIVLLEEREKQGSELWADLDRFRQQMEKGLSRLAQEQRVHNSENEKRLQTWADEMQRQLQRIQVWESDQKRYAALNEEGERMLATLRELERQISLRMDELAEVQRLHAERLNDQMGDMNAAQEKRWQGHQRETELAEKERAKWEEDLKADLTRIGSEVEANAGQVAEVRQAFGRLFSEISDLSEDMMGTSGAATPSRRSRRRKKPSKAELAAAATADVRIVEGDGD